MPELPDLQVYSGNLMKRIGNKKVTSVKLYNFNKVNQAEETVREKWLGKCISEITRIGKELYFHSDDGDVFSVHLMLSGRFDICNEEDVKRISWKVASFGFEDGQALAVSDAQSMCKVTFDPKPAGAPDALSPKFSYDCFLGIVKKSARKNIKAFLIDQNIVKGIGNAYADEILWAANISPESTTGKIPPDYLEKLYNAIPAVLNDAMENIRKINPEIIAGEERGFLRVHNPRKKVTEDGGKIMMKKVAMKTTYYTDKQVLFM